MKNAIILLADGFELCEALIVADLLKRAKINTTLISISNSLEVNSSCDVKVKCDKTLIEVSDFDAIILPGGMPGTTNLMNSNIVNNLVLDAYNNNKLVCAICAAPTILAKLNLLDNKPATVFPGMEEDLINHNAIAKNEGVVKIDNIITAQALGSAFEFALCIIESLLDKESSNQVKQAIYLK